MGGGYNGGTVSGSVSGNGDGVKNWGLNVKNQDGTASGSVSGETSGIAADVLFTASATYTRYAGEVQIDPEVLALGNIKGYVQLPDLNIAMSLNAGENGEAANDAIFLYGYKFLRVA